MQVPPQRTGPLVGLKVLEIGHYIAAPFCTRILADLGAEVIKVEPPGGDPFRGWGAVGRRALGVVQRAWPQQAVDRAGSEARPRNAAAAGRARRRAGGEPARRAIWSGCGLGPDALHAVNPRLVIARISGYGQDGPYRDKPAFGAIGEAMGGLRHLTGHPAGSSDLPPPRCGISISDDLAGLYAAIGLLSALWQRDATGTGRGPRGRRQPRGQRVQPDGRHAAGIRDGRAGAAAGGRGDRDRVADQHLSLRRREMAVHRRQLRPDLRPADGGDRPAGAGGRSGLRDQRRPLRTSRRAGRGDRRLDPDTAGEGGRGSGWRRRTCRARGCYDIADCANDPHFRRASSVQAVDRSADRRGRCIPGRSIRLDGEAPETVVAGPVRRPGAHTEYVLRTLLGMGEQPG